MRMTPRFLTKSLATLASSGQYDAMQSFGPFVRSGGLAVCAHGCVKLMASFMAPFLAQNLLTRSKHACFSL